MYYHQITKRVDQVTKTRYNIPWLLKELTKYTDQLTFGTKQHLELPFLDFGQLHVPDD